MHQNEHFLFISSSLIMMKKADFSKMLKTHQFLNVFALLKRYDKKKCPRRVFFAADYESSLFSSFALSTGPLGLSWGH